MMDVPNGCGRTAMIVTMTTAMVGITICDDSDDDYGDWDDGGDDFVAVDDGGNYDRDDFCDSDEGSNDRTGIVNSLIYDDGNDLRWWLL